MPTKTDYIFIGVGAFTAILLTSYVPSLMKVMSLNQPKDEYASCPACKEEHNKLPPSIENYMSIESIPGIDLTLLRTVKQKFPELR